MALALANNPQEALLLALRDLDENDFKILKFHLQDRTLLGGQGLPRGELEGLSRVDLASRLVLMNGAQGAVKVVCKVLEVMKLLELVDQLSHICLNGEYSRGQGEVRVALDFPSPLCPCLGAPVPEGPRGPSGLQLKTHDCGVKGQS